MSAAEHVRLWLARRLTGCRFAASLAGRRDGVLFGLGPYPAMIPDDQWVAAVTKLIKERGADAVLRDMLRNLREAFQPSNDA